MTSCRAPSCHTPTHTSTPTSTSRGARTTSPSLSRRMAASSGTVTTLRSGSQHQLKGLGNLRDFAFGNNLFGYLVIWLPECLRLLISCSWFRQYTVANSAHSYWLFYFRVELLGPIFASLLDLCLENVLFGLYFLLPTAPQPQPNIPASEIGCK